MRGHDIWTCVYLVAGADKWYQCDKGIELENIKHKVNDKNTVINVVDPSWLYDYHTHEGKKRISLGTADLRLDGRWEKRFSILKRYVDLVCINPELSKDDLKKLWVKSHY